GEVFNPFVEPWYTNAAPSSALPLSYFGAPTITSPAPSPSTSPAPAPAQPYSSKPCPGVTDQSAPSLGPPGPPRNRRALPESLWASFHPGAPTIAAAQPAPLTSPAGPTAGPTNAPRC